MWHMRYYFGLPFIAVLCIFILIAVVAVRRFGPAARNMPVLEQRTDTVIMGTVTPGKEILITKVQLSKPGFVVIHKDDGGQPGDIVAVGELLPAGESEDITLTVNEGLKIGEEYIAMLHGDDGNGVYDDPNTDGPLIIQNAVVSQEFTIANE